MRFLSEVPNIDFMGQRKVALGFSILVTIVALVSLGVRGLHFAVDFTGGAVMEVSYKQEADLDGIRKALATSELGEAVAQHFGTTREVLIRVAPKEGVTSQQMGEKLARILPGAEVRRVDLVGPQVGAELAEQGFLATLYALTAIFFYVALRFQKWFSFGAVVATVHDVIATVGAISLFGFEFDLPALAAVLAVIGYSLNDTIVIYDRIRECFRKQRRLSAIEVINLSVNQTLSRTIMTHFVTMLSVLALYFLGGEMIRSFAFAMIVGIVVGTYSSIYVASSLVLYLGITREDLMPVVKEGAEGDQTP
jgi:preprotein translocase subunit SecF